MPRGRFSRFPVYPDPVTGVPMKHCHVCGEDKPLTLFTMRTEALPASRCKACIAKVKREELRAMTAAERHILYRHRWQMTKQQRARRAMEVAHADA
jgi:hypothetical protein